MARKANTRAAAGNGTIRQRPDGRWEARVTVGRDPGTGRQRQRSIYGSTQKEVAEKLRALTAEIDKGTYIEPTKLTVGKWLDIWQADYLTDVKPRTAALYRSTIERYILPAFGATKLEALQAHAAQRFYNGLAKDTAHPLSAKTIKNVHGIFHKAITQAVELGYLRFNPLDACKLPKTVKKEIKPLDEPAIAQLIAAIKGSKFENEIFVALFTGMREGELIGLTWDCIDFARGTININKQLQLQAGNGYCFVSPKNGKGRVITPAAAVMDVLRRQSRKQSAQRLAAGRAWENLHNLVFTNETGRNIATRTLFREYKRIVESIGHPDARFHDLRHSYAVAALLNGDDIKTVQENLGHHAAAFTLDVYAHATEQMKAASAARMDAFIKGVSNL